LHGLPGSPISCLGVAWGRSSMPEYRVYIFGADGQ
jgi:hypothetical protein